MEASSQIEQAFLATIQNDPQDPSVRLVFADWLEERGDLRGEFLRLDCLLSSHSEQSLVERHQARLDCLRWDVDTDWLLAIGILYKPPGRCEWCGNRIECEYDDREPFFDNPADDYRKYVRHLYRHYCCLCLQTKDGEVLERYEDWLLVQDPRTS